MADRTVSVSLTANALPFIAGMGKAAGAAEGLQAKAVGLSKNLKLLGTAFVGVALVKSLGEATKSAADFQTKIIRLQTDANETGANLTLVSKGILQLAGATGNTTDELAKGAYKIESAGFHGADALTTLRAAAEGAKVGQADLTTVADALTTALVDYHSPASSAVAVTDQLIATVSRGKTDLEALSGSLATVAPAAATAHVGLDQVLGSMATMTAMGTPANKAATYLRQTLTALADPLPKAQAEMTGLGLSSIDVSKNLGQRGLTGTLQVLVDAINSKLGPAGLVALQSFTTTTGSTKDLANAMGLLPQKQQTVVASLADLVGGAKSLQSILELTQTTAGKLEVNPTLVQNVKDIDEAAKNAGQHVTDWGVTQDTLNQQLDQMHDALSAAKITLGQEFLPIATKVARWASDLADTLTKYPNLTKKVLEGFLLLGGGLIGLKLLNGALTVLMTTTSRSIALRRTMTGALLGEAAAADKATKSMAGLDVAEGAGVGRTGGLLRGIKAIPTGIGLMGVEGGLAGVGAGVTSVVVLGGTIAVAGLAAGITWLGTKVAEGINGKGVTGDTSQYKRTTGATSNGNNTYVPGNNGGPVQVGAGLAGHGAGVDHGSALRLSTLGNGVKGLDDDSAALSKATREMDRQSQAIHGLDDDSAKLGQSYVVLGKTVSLTATQLSQLRSAQAELGPKGVGGQLYNLVQKQVAAFTVLNTAGSNAVVANENYQASVDGLRQSVKDNGRTLDDNTVKGRNNIDAFNAQATAINEVDTAFFQAQSASKGHAKALQEVTDKLATQKKSLEDQATALGICPGPRRRSSSTSCC
jgi:TP901 family phage tail tape measure protein